MLSVYIWMAHKVKYSVNRLLASDGRVNVFNLCVILGSYISFPFFCEENIQELLITARTLTPSFGRMVAPSTHWIGISWVSEGTNEYFLSIRMIVILPSSCANRSPTHVLGPLPNGIQANGCLSDFLCSVNLKKVQKRPC